MTDVGQATIEEEIPLSTKISCTILGPFFGMLPPSVQERFFGYNAARVLSTTSRVFNVAAGVYSIASIASKAFGVDIDPTSGQTLTWTGGILGIDSLIREGAYAVRYVSNHPFMSYTDPWGEPITSIIYESKKKEQ